MTSDPILVAVCDEPDGLIDREVRPLIMTIENVRRFWELARHFKYIFDRDVQDDFALFCEMIFSQDPKGGVTSNGLFWVVDDFIGIFYMTNIVPGVDAKVHYLFFDRRHNGRVELVQEMVKYVFRKYNFRRLSVDLPFYSSKHTFNFLNQIGFTKEGRKRKAIWHNDDWFDVAIFGILKEEALNGNV